MKKIKDELRIPYLDTTTARNADRRTFEDYREGIITPETGACLIGKHNRVEVTVEQFIAKCRLVRIPQGRLQDRVLPR